MMDVSGSMGNEQKEIVRPQAFWIDTAAAQLQKRRNPVHHPRRRRKEVPRDVFAARKSCGTLISSAYKLAVKILDEDYPAADWNIYPFHFSDGDNWSANDTKAACSSFRSTFCR